MIYPCRACGQSMNIERPGTYACPSCAGLIVVGQVVEPMPAVHDYPSYEQLPVNTTRPYGYRPSYTSTRSDKSRVGFVLLGLFFGMMGIHNFYAGHTGRAVAQLLITLFLWWLIVPLFCVAFWVLIEVCVVNKDSNRRRMT